jgi:hypothetical protein
MRVIRIRRISNISLVSLKKTGIIFALFLLHGSYLVNRADVSTTIDSDKEHEHIEAEEDAREREFEGLPSNAPLTEDRVVEDPLDAHAHGSQDDQAPGAQDQDQDQTAFRRPAGSNQGRPARIERTRPSTEDLGRLAKEAREQGTWGERDMHRPRNDRERMRKGTPYSQYLSLASLRMGGVERDLR